MTSAFIFHPPSSHPLRWVTHPREVGKRNPGAAPLPGFESELRRRLLPFPGAPRGGDVTVRARARQRAAVLRSVSASLCVCVSVLVWTTQGGGCPGGMGAGQRAWGAPPTIRALMDGGDGRVCISACARCNPRSLLGDPFWIWEAQSFGLLFLSFLYL